MKVKERKGCVETTMVCFSDIEFLLLFPSHTNTASGKSTTRAEGQEPVFNNPFVRRNYFNRQGLTDLRPVTRAFIYYWSESILGKLRLEYGLGTETAAGRSKHGILR